MKISNILFATATVILLYSCSCPDEDEVSRYFSNSTKEWFVDSCDNDFFLMVDNQLISESFSLYNKNYEQFHVNNYSRNESCIKSQVEKYYREYNSTYRHNFKLSIYAYYNGDEISIKVNNLDFRYNLELQKLVDIFYDNYSLSKYYTDDGLEGDAIYSSVDFMDTLTVNQKLYTGIMHFTLNDFTDYQNEFTVNEIFIAKHFGLIKYKLQGGIEYAKLFNQ